jgi:hypothetical protein
MSILKLVSFCQENVGLTVTSDEALREAEQPRRDVKNDEIKLKLNIESYSYVLSS